MYIYIFFMWKIVTKPFGVECSIFLALLVFINQSYCHGAGVRRPSVNSGFSETLARIQPKFYGKLPIHHV